MRGVALAGTVRAARSLDETALANALEHSASAALRRTVASLDERAWYPAEAHIELVELMFDHVAKKQATTLAGLARTAVLADLRGIYRVLLRVVSPSYLVQRLEKVVRSYANYAQVAVHYRTPFSATVTLAMRPSSEALWSWLGGIIQGALEAAGADTVTVERKGVASSDGCRYTLSWS